MFSDADHIAGLTRIKQLAAGQSQPEIVDGNKVEFAKHVNSLTADKFAAFKSLFDCFNKMLNSQV